MANAILIRLIASLWCAFLIFIFRDGVTGNNDLRHDIFTANTLLNGYSCAGDLAVKVSPRDVIDVSRSKCAFNCADHYECIGFFHKIDGSRKTCLLCNHLLNSVDIVNLAEMAGSEYFNRSDCNGWVHGVKSLRVFFESANHSEAQARCEDDGGTLARIKDESQMNQIQAALTSCTNYKTKLRYWTDGTLDSTTGTWTYSDGTPMPMTEIVYWDSGSPDQNDRCTRLKYISTYEKYLWNDVGCHVKYWFICQYS